IKTANSKTVYTTSRVNQKAAFMPADWPFLDEVLGALRSLGIVSKEACESHKAWCMEVSRAKDAKTASECYVPRLEKHGVVLTAKQRATLEAACKVRR